VLIAFSVIARVAYLHLMEFKGDELHFLSQAYLNARSFGSIRSLNSSLPLPHPPLLVFVLALPVFFTVDPIIVTGWIVLLNIVGIWLLFEFLSEFFSRYVAILGTALFATAPWAVILSRKIWNPDIAFPFAIAFYFLFFIAIKDGKCWKVVIASVALAIACQSHLSFLMLLPTVVIYLLLVRPPIAFRTYGVCLIVVTSLLLPYVIDVVSHHSGGTQDFFASVVHSFSMPNASEFFSQLDWAVAASSGTHFDFLLGQQGFETFVSSNHLGFCLAILRFVVLFMYVCLIFQVAVLLKGLFKVGSRSLGMQQCILLFFFIHFCIVILAYSLVHVPPFAHYYVVLYPIFPLVFALTWDQLYRKYDWNPVRFMMHVISLGIVVVNTVFILSFFSFIGRAPEAIFGDYGRPYVLDRTQWEQQIQLFVRQHKWESR